MIRFPHTRGIAGRPPGGHRSRRGAPVGCRRPSCWPEFTARRVELRLTCRAIARALTAAGATTTPQTVTWWERQGHRPSERRIDLLAATLRVSRPAVLAMFALDFGGEDRRGHRDAQRRPVGGA